MSFPTLLVPEFLPSQHEPSHVQVAEQRTDRRPLRRSSTFVPIARTPMFVPALVGLFDRSFQPHLSQMQHGSIDDPASYRLHQLGMRNTVKVTAENAQMLVGGKRHRQQIIANMVPSLGNEVTLHVRLTTEIRPKTGNESLC